jgi:pimeloyl-ACP methyl ester carboxylesterase
VKSHVRLARLVTVLWGTEDTWIPLETGERLAVGIRGANLTRVEDAGHLIQLDAPVALATALRSWLLRVSG